MSSPTNSGTGSLRALRGRDHDIATFVAEAQKGSFHFSEIKNTTLGKLVRILREDPLRIPVRLRGMVFALRLAMRRNVELEGKLVVMGSPKIDIRKGSSLFLGNGVVLNSRNRGYHINMHSPVKLFADRPGAEIRIGEGTRIAGTCIHAYRSVVIGKRCMVAANCQIFDGNAHGLSFPDVEQRIHTEGLARPIVIEDDVWIGANSIVLPGVRIGKGSVVGVGSVVTKNVPPMTIVRGNPAEVMLDYNELSKSE